MKIKEYIQLLHYIEENNCWGIKMYDCIKRGRKCVKYVHTSFDTRTGDIYSVRFNLGFSNESVDFRVENKEDLQAIYDWLDEKVKRDA